jgi:hypothetical protein
MSRIVIVILIYHCHIPIDSINPLDSQRRRNVFAVRYEQTYRVELKSMNCIRLSIFRAFTIILKNYAGNKQKLYKITKMQMSAKLGQEKPDTRNIRGLNLAAVKRTTV